MSETPAGGHSADYDARVCGNCGASWTVDISICPECEHNTTADRCPEFPPLMSQNMRGTIGAQYHRCRLAAGHKPPCVNAEGSTWGSVITSAETAEGSSDE